MNATSQHRSTTKRVVIDGPLDILTTPRIESNLIAEIEIGPVRLIIDCRQLDYISTAGLWMLVGLLKRIKRAGGSLVLCDLKTYLQDLLEVATGDHGPAIGTCLVRQLITCFF